MNRTKGLTILEVLIALAVIGVVFAAVASLQMSNLRVTHDADLETQRLQDAVRLFEQEKRKIEERFEDYLECPTTTTVDCEWAPKTDYETVTISIQGRPTVEAEGVTVATHGVIQVDITLGDENGTLDFRQFVSCLESTATPRPSVAEPGKKCTS